MDSSQNLFGDWQADWFGLNMLRNKKFALLMKELEIYLVELGEKQKQKWG